MSARRLGVVAMIAWYAAAGIALAEPRPSPTGTDSEAIKAKVRADALYASGMQYFSAGEYVEAIAQFTDAYAIVRDPIFLYNIALSYRKVGDCIQSASYYEQYVAAAPTASNRPRVEQWLTELEPCVKQREADLERVRRETADRLHPRTARVDAGRGLRISGLVVGAAGIAALAVGAGFAHHGAIVEDEVQRACQAGCTWDTGANPESAKDRDGRSANTVATWLLVGGAASALVGGGLYYLGFHRTETIVVVPTADGGASAILLGRF